MTVIVGSRGRQSWVGVKLAVVGAVICLAFGALLTTSGASSVISARHALANGQKVTAEVDSNNRTSTNQRRGPDIITFTPTIRFETVADSEAIYTQLPGQKNYPEYFIGESVEIIYDTTNPENVLKDTPGELTGLYVKMYAGIAGLVLGGGLAVLAFWLRLRKSATP